MTPEDKALCDGLRFDHVAWLRYVVDDNGGKPLRISVCGSDDAGAFRVFMVDLTFAAATRIEALSADVERLNDDLMACVAPAEVGGGIVNHVIERERKRAEQAEAEVERLKASRDTVDAENGRLVVEVERLKAELAEAQKEAGKWRSDFDAEREAHAKTKAALLAWQMGEGDTETEARANRAEADLSIARAHERTLCDTLDSEIAKRQDAEHRANRAEAVIAGMWAKLQHTLGEERTAKREAIKMNDFIPERVRQGRFNLTEDVMNELNDLLAKHGVTLEEQK